MTREQAINYIWHLTDQVMHEFCCSDRERDDLIKDTEDAIAALRKR